MKITNNQQILSVNLLYIKLLIICIKLFNRKMEKLFWNIFLFMMLAYLVERSSEEYYIMDFEYPESMYIYFINCLFGILT